MVIFIELFEYSKIVSIEIFIVLKKTLDSAGIYRNALMDSLQVQFKNRSAAAIFLWFTSEYSKMFFIGPIVKKMCNWADILQNHTYGQSAGALKRFSCGHFVLSYMSKITECFSLEHSQEKVRLS